MLFHQIVVTGTLILVLKKHSSLLLIILFNKCSKSLKIKKISNESYYNIKYANEKRDSIIT